MTKASGFDGYNYYINEDSDEDDFKQNSSDEENLDEVSIFLYGTPEQKRRALKSLTGDEASSSDDDFEKLMQVELEEKVKALENSWNKSVNKDNAAQSTTASTSNSNDKAYFDSGENQDCSKKKAMTDDELLYDPVADEEDQKWVDMHRKRPAQATHGSTGSTKKAKPKGSDAILNCPACMTTLCMDCQRHSIYQNQYRAMFVMNCDVKLDEVLHYKSKKKKQFKRHQRKVKERPAEPELGSSSFTRLSVDEERSAEDTYHPVKCSTCNTEVAVYDSEEIYHFFNVLSAYA